MDIRVQMPPSEEGALLLKRNVMTEEFYVLYKKDTDGDGYIFAGNYHLGKIYDKNYIAVPFTSTYAGKCRWKAGTIFSNVLGSSSGEERKIYYKEKKSSWETIAKDLKITWQCLAERDMFYDVQTKKPYVPAFDVEKDKYLCDDIDVQGKLVHPNIVGGHVVLSDFPRRMRKGSDVFIIPLCKHHNSKNVPHKNSQNRNTTPGNGNGFYMKLGNDTDVIMLTGYLYPSQIT